jgi:hypothetical protein
MAFISVSFNFQPGKGKNCILIGFTTDGLIQTVKKKARSLVGNGLRVVFG